MSELKECRLWLPVVAGKPPSESGCTRVVLVLSDEDEPKKWGAKILSQAEDTFTIRIFTPPQLQVGKWKFCFDTILKMNEKEKPFRYTYDQPIYVLFNPWCPGKKNNFTDWKSNRDI